VGAGLFQARAAINPLSISASGNAGSGLSVNLGWTASSSTNVTGYFLNWGLKSGQCTNQLDVGNVTNATVNGLVTNTSYFFNVVAYDVAGDQAPPSNELAYPPLQPVVSLQPLNNHTNPVTLRLNFQANAGTSYTVQATRDFKQWVTVWTTNSAPGGIIVYTTTDAAFYPSRFYRVLAQ
jgi:hypothetical protein